MIFVSMLDKAWFKEPDGPMKSGPCIENYIYSWKVHFTIAADRNLEGQISIGP